MTNLLVFANNRPDPQLVVVAADDETGFQRTYDDATVGFLTLDTLAARVETNP